MPNAFPGFSTDNCQPFYFQVDPANGSTLTRADVVPFTKTTLANLGLTELGMDKVIASTKEARMAGVSQRSLYDLLLSRHVPAVGGQPAGSGSIIAPYTLVPREYAVNALYFHATAGSGTLPGGFTAGAVHATYGYIPLGAWRLTISNGASSPIGLSGNYNSNLQNIEKYFLPGSHIFVESTVRYFGAAYQSAVTGGGGTLDDLMGAHLKVHAAINLSATTAYLVVSPTYGNTTSSALDTAWNALTTAQKDAYRVTQGTVLKMANSVSDYEQFCYQAPATNNRDLLEFWHQTSRWTHKWNDEYRKALENPNMSDFFKKFRSLPLAQQRAQQEAQAIQDFHNTVFYGDAIDSLNQTLGNWTNLPIVEDPYNPGTKIEYKANTLGIRTQLNRCNRVIDKQGGALNIDWIMENMGYGLSRERGNNGSEVTEIDLMTDRGTASIFRDVMVRYYKAKSAIDTSVLIGEGKSVVATVGDKKKSVFQYNSYWLPDQGVTLNVFTDRYFDDAIGSALALGSSPNKNRARRLWAIDWSDVNINLHGVRTVKRDGNSDVVDKLYNCTMSEVKNHYTLWSKKYDVRLGNTNRHLIIENFSDAQPTVTVPGYTVGA